MNDKTGRSGHRHILLPFLLLVFWGAPLDACFPAGHDEAAAARTEEVSATKGAGTDAVHDKKSHADGNALIDHTAADAASETIKTFFSLIVSGKASTAAALCRERGEAILTDAFISDMKLFSAYAITVGSHSGASRETVSAVATLKNFGDVITQEYSLYYDEKKKAFQIQNVFDRQYDKMDEARRRCHMTEIFLESAWKAFPETLADREPDRSDGNPSLVTAGLLNEIPKCPQGSAYSLFRPADADTGACDISIICPAHGGPEELFKIGGNLEASGALSSEIATAETELVAKYGTESLRSLMAVRQGAVEVENLIRSGDLNMAMARFRDAQKTDKRLGTTYVKLAGALEESGHFIEAAALMAECAAVYPKWPAAKRAPVPEAPHGPRRREKPAAGR